jgi:predicted dithiol-disulfide oxidoreductase (DUF899 family)
MATETQHSALPPIVSREEWQATRDALLAKEKAHTRAGDAIAAERRRLPMVRIDKDYVFDGGQGEVRFVDLFEGRRQLVLQHFMFHPDWDAGCPGCTRTTSQIGSVDLLREKDTTFVLVSRAPLEKLLAYREQKGWTLPWYSSGRSTFNQDFGMTSEGGEEGQGVSVFLRDGEDIYHTYQTGGRGVDHLLLEYAYLDLTPYGRQEAWEDSPTGWPQDG